jgi:hypothetical protein
MPRSRLCRACGDFHDTESPWPEACAGHFRTRANDAPNIRTDGMDPVKSMADGKTYDSKSAYYGSVKRAGCEIVGNDAGGFGKRPEYTAPNLRRDLKQALERHGL